MNQVKIGRFIAQLRQERGWTQEELGEQLGVTNKTVSRWENGNYMPGVEMLTLLGKELEVSLNELIEGRRLEGDEFHAAAEQNLAAALEGPGERLRRWMNRYGTFAAVTLVLCVMLATAAAMNWQYRKAHPEDSQTPGTFACRDVYYDSGYTWIYLTFHYDGRYYIFDGSGTLFEYGGYVRAGDVVQMDSGEGTRWAVIKGSRVYDASPIGKGLLSYEHIEKQPLFVNSQLWPPEAQPWPEQLPEAD